MQLLGVERQPHAIVLRQALHTGQPGDQTHRVGAAEAQIGERFVTEELDVLDRRLEYQAASGLAGQRKCLRS